MLHGALLVTLRGKTSNRTNLNEEKSISVTFDGDYFPFCWVLSFSNVIQCHSMMIEKCEPQQNSRDQKLIGTFNEGFYSTEDMRHT